MKKKLMSILLGAAMCMSLLAGCGNGAKDNQTAAADAYDSSAQTESTQSQASDEAQETSDTQQAASGEKITLQFWNVFTVLMAIFCVRL